MRTISSASETKRAARAEREREEVSVEVFTLTGESGSRSTYTCHHGFEWSPAQF